MKKVFKNAHQTEFPAGTNNTVQCRYHLLYFKCQITVPVDLILFYQNVRSFFSIDNIGLFSVFVIPNKFMREIYSRVIFLHVPLLVNISGHFL